MVIAARTVSQVGTHMGIAFCIMYFLTGSIAFGGMAALLEPVINVGLLPLHKRAWRKVRELANSRLTTLFAAERASQVCMHMGVAFAVMYWATGSMAFGGLAAVLEPICNVLLLPFHDKAWERLGRRLDSARALRPLIA